MTANDRWRKPPSQEFRLPCAPAARKMPAEAFPVGMPSGIRTEFALRSRRRARRWLWLVLFGASACAHGQTCQTAEDMDASVRTALEAVAKRYFEMSARGDTLALEQNSIASVVANFAR